MRTFFLRLGAFVVHVDGPAALKQGRVVDHRAEGARDVLADLARVVARALPVEVGLEPVADGLVQQDAAVAGRQHDLHLPGGRLARVEQDQRLSGGLFGVLLGRSARRNSRGSCVRRRRSARTRVARCPRRPREFRSASAAERRGRYGRQLVAIRISRTSSENDASTFLMRESNARAVRLARSSSARLSRPSTSRVSRSTAYRSGRTKARARSTPSGDALPRCEPPFPRRASWRPRRDPRRRRSRSRRPAARARRGPCWCRARRCA